MVQVSHRMEMKSKSYKLFSIGSTKSPMASRKIPLPSPEKLKTRNTQWRSSMSVMKRGTVWLQAKVPPRLQTTICRCMSLTLTIVVDNSLMFQTTATTLPFQTPLDLLGETILLTPAFHLIPGRFLLPLTPRVRLLKLTYRSFTN